MRANPNPDIFEKAGGYEYNLPDQDRIPMVYINI